MQFWFVISLFFSVIIAIFAVQNSDVVKIDLFWYDWNLSQSLVILISAAFGAIITIFLGLFGKIKSSLRMRELTADLKAAEKKIELLSNSVKSFEEKAAAAKAQSYAASQSPSQPAPQAAVSQDAKASAGAPGKE